ncbi:MAG: hypothetical protein SFU87_11140 [Chitinophagaceae bacterium]|nr:hypothetical protein [Chitinophagaceae bacterium]
MKKLLVMIFLFVSSHLFSQTCGYFPAQEGAVFEMQTFNEKGKLQLINTSVVKVINGDKITIDAKVVDEKNKPVTSMTYDAICKDGNLTIDGGAFVPAGMFEGKNNATVSITGDKIVYSQALNSGQTLPDASIGIKMEMQGMPFPFNSDVKITNRKVVGEEEITVPAGTFKCWKITYDIQYKMLISFRGTAVEWIAPGKGFIKSESYTKNNKLAGYSVRTK